MTDAPAPDEFATPEGASPEADAALGELRYVGPATEATLADAGIDASTILDKSISFVQLVKLGVAPGVAGHIRREYSLPWSNAPTWGERLQRRAGHVRHLRPDERTWIDESRSTVRPGAAPSTNAATDGSGSATDAEHAWRERSRPGTRSDPDDAPAADRSTAGPEPDPTREAQSTMESPINPTNHTVPELNEVIETIGDPAALGAVLRAERAGDRRTTALEAIEDRLQALGADPDAVASPAPNPGHGGPTREVPPLRPQAAVDTVTETIPQEELSAWTADVATQLNEHVTAGREAVDRTLDAARRALHRQETRLRRLEADDWQQLSLALLLGITAYSVLLTLAVALQPALGLPLGALPLFAVVGVLGVTSAPLRWWDTPGGFGLSIVTGLLGIGAVGLIAAGAVGEVNPGSAPITLPAYLVIAVALVVTTYRSRGT